MAEPKVYLFWDNSNIFISARQVVPYKDPRAVENALRVHFLNLYKLAVAGRSYGGGMAVGSVPPEQRGLWGKMKEDTGIDLVLLERGEISGTEQGVDQMLQTHMLRTALDNQDNPQVAVLLTEMAPASAMAPVSTRIWSVYTKMVGESKFWPGTSRARES